MKALRLTRLLILAACVVPAHGGLIQIASPAGLAANYSIDWATLGGDLTALSPPTAISVTPSGSATLSGSTAFTIFSGSTYNADFLPGDTILSAYDLASFTPLSTGIRIDFLFPVHAVGTRVQVNSFSSFTATLEAFDSGLTSLGTVQVNGTVLGNGDGSAPFLGASSNALIRSVLITANQDGVAINNVAISSVPEPGTLGLIGAALAVFAIRLRKR